jgi:hypothetical protein
VISVPEVGQIWVSKIEIAPGRRWCIPVALAGDKVLVERVSPQLRIVYFVALNGYRDSYNFSHFLDYFELLGTE